MGVCGIRAFREYDAVHFLPQHRHRCRGYREIKIVQNRYIAPDAKSGTIYRYCYYTVFTGRMQQKSVNSLCKIRFLPRDTRTGLPIPRVLTRQSQKSSCKMPKTIPMKKPPQKATEVSFPNPVHRASYSARTSDAQPSGTAPSSGQPYLSSSRTYVELMQALSGGAGKKTVSSSGSNRRMIAPRSYS